VRQFPAGARAVGGNQVNACVEAIHGIVAETLRKMLREGSPDA
jgi:hypothetical protein